MRFIIVILFFFISLPTVAKGSLKLAVTPYILNLYQSFLDGRDPHLIQDYYHPSVERIMLDILVQEQALWISTCHYAIELEIVGDKTDRLQTLLRGQTALSYDSFWYEEIKSLTDQVWISDPVIEKGQYRVGIYTAANNERALSATNLTELQALSIVTNPDWVTDNEAISQLGMKNIKHEHHWISMSRLVSGNWVDVMLAPFTVEPDLSYPMYQPALLPIPNLTVMLAGSRHLIVSKQHEEGEKIYNCLQQGLKQLKQSGELKKMYEQGVFFSHKTANWSQLNK